VETGEKVNSCNERRKRGEITFSIFTRRKKRGKEREREK
jgi:hypothetical protein